jgi:hypothetical protein
MAFAWSEPSGTMRRTAVLTPTLGQGDESLHEALSGQWLRLP